MMKTNSKKNILSQYHSDSEIPKHDSSYILYGLLSARLEKRIMTVQILQLKFQFKILNLEDRFILNID